MHVTHTHTSSSDSVLLCCAKNKNKASSLVCRQKNEFVCCHQNSNPQNNQKNFMPSSLSNRKKMSNFSENEKFKSSQKSAIRKLFYAEFCHCHFNLNRPAPFGKLPSMSKYYTCMPHKNFKHTFTGLHLFQRTI